VREIRPRRRPVRPQRCDEKDRQNSDPVHNPFEHNVVTLQAPNRLTLEAGIGRSRPMVCSLQL
jgi:hypothetical protein